MLKESKFCIICFCWSVSWLSLFPLYWITAIPYFPGSEHWGVWILLSDLVVHNNLASCSEHFYLMTSVPVDRWARCIGSLQHHFLGFEYWGMHLLLPIVAHYNSASCSAHFYVMIFVLVHGLEISWCLGMSTMVKHLCCCWTGLC